MNYKLRLGLFLILAAVVLGSADDKSQSQDLELSDKIKRAARAAENSKRQKKSQKKTQKLIRKRNKAGKKRKINKGKTKCGSAKEKKSVENKWTGLFLPIFSKWTGLNC